MMDQPNSWGKHKIALGIFENMPKFIENSQMGKSVEISDALFQCYININ